MFDRLFGHRPHLPATPGRISSSRSRSSSVTTSAFLPIRNATDVVTAELVTLAESSMLVIYRFRGFAPAVYTHAFYDVWVLVF